MKNIKFGHFDKNVIEQPMVFCKAISQLDDSNTYLPISFLGKTEDSKYYYYIALRKNPDSIDIVKITIYTISDNVPPAIIQVDSILRSAIEDSDND